MNFTRFECGFEVSLVSSVVFEFHSFRVWLWSFTRFECSLGMNAKDVLELVLVTQYFDTIKELGSHNNTKIIFSQSEMNENGSKLHSKRGEIDLHSFRVEF